MITQGFQTNSKQTDSDKDAMVQAVRQASKEYWAVWTNTYNNETFDKFMKYVDIKSDQMWQSEPVATIHNTDIIYKQADANKVAASMLENRISTPVNVQKAHYSVLSDNKVLEVLEANVSVIMKDSTVIGPLSWVASLIWANIDGDWKIQFLHSSYQPQSE